MKKSFQKLRLFDTWQKKNSIKIKLLLVVEKEVFKIQSLDPWKKKSFKIPTFVLSLKIFFKKYISSKSHVFSIEKEIIFKEFFFFKPSLIIPWSLKNPGKNILKII